MLHDRFVARFRTIAQLIDAARRTRGEPEGRHHSRRLKVPPQEAKVLAYLRRRKGGRATQAEIARKVLRDSPFGNAMVGVLNGLFERRLVRFLAGDVVELTQQGRAFRG